MKQKKTRKAYRPWRIKYYRGGYPPVRVPPPVGYTPVRVLPSGYPCQGIPPSWLRGTWGTPLGTPIGVPPSWLGGVPLGTPHWGTPVLARGYPHWGTSPLGYPYPGLGGTQGTPRQGTPPAGVPPWVWTDRRTDTSRNITFPSYYVRGQ